MPPIFVELKVRIFSLRSKSTESMQTLANGMVEVITCKSWLYFNKKIWLTRTEFINDSFKNKAIALWGVSCYLTNKIDWLHLRLQANFGTYMEWDDVYEQKNRIKRNISRIQSFLETVCSALSDLSFGPRKSMHSSGEVIDGWSP